MRLPTSCVVPPSAEQLRAVVDARRKLIETAAVARARQNGGEAFQTELGAALSAQKTMVESLHSAQPSNRTQRAALEWRVLEADLQFHHVSFDHADNPLIHLMAEALNGQLCRARQSAKRGLAGADAALAEHKAIFEAGQLLARQELRSHREPKGGARSHFVRAARLWLHRLRRRRARGLRRKPALPDQSYRQYWKPRHEGGPVTATGVLRFDNIAKAFGGTQALKGVSFEVRRGEIVALLGENGAGKSTLIKILSGVHKADAGAISLDGAPYQSGGVEDDHKVAFVHQDLGLIEWMTLTENVGLARGFARRSLFGRHGIIDWAACDRTARNALALIGCEIDPGTRIQSLSRTEKSLVAIARALVVDCDFLVLDEPTASLPADEVERLFAAMGSMKARGVGMIYVSHRIDEVFRVADRVVVLRDGRLVGEERVDETDSARLIGMIVGRTTFDAFQKDQSQPGAVRVSVSG